MSVISDIIKGNIMLKKIIKIGFTNVMPSIVPILIWTVLSVLYKNNEMSKGFSITYPYQFLFMFLYAISVQGQIKSEAKNHELGDKANSGILVFYMASTVVIMLTFIFRKQVLSYYKFDHRDYTEILMYGVIMLVCDYSVYCLTLIKQYREQHKKAFITNVKWYGSRVLVVLIVRCFTSNYKTALIAVICTQIGILAMFVCRNIRFKKFGISIIEGLKYSMSYLPADVLMCFTYVFGYRNVTNIGGEYFTAYNIEALCTDTQWDILDSGIDTAVTTEVCDNGNKNNKHLRLCCVLYSLILFGTSAIMLLLYALIFVEADMGLVWKMFFY